jgi:hypothetical protein
MFGQFLPNKNKNDTVLLQCFFQTLDAQSWASKQGRWRQHKSKNFSQL